MIKNGAETEVKAGGCCACVRKNHPHRLRNVLLLVFAILAAVGGSTGVGIYVGSLRRSNIVYLESGATLEDLSAALSSCSTACTIRFGPGTFYLDAPRPSPNEFDFRVLFASQKTSLTLVGAGSDAGVGTELVLGGWFAGFNFENIKVLNFSGFAVTTRRAPVTLVTVTAVAPASTTFSCHSRNGNNCRIPFAANETWVSNMYSLLEWDPVTNKPMLDGLDYYAGSSYSFDPFSLVWSDNGQTISMAYGTDRVSVELGKTYVIRHSLGPVQWFFSGADSISLENINIHSAFHFVILFKHSKSIVLDTVNVVRKDTRQFLTAVADAFHFANCHGDITVRNCEVERNGDDAVNVESLFRQISSIDPSRKSFVTVDAEKQPIDWNSIRSGTIVIYKRSTYETLLSTKVLDADPDTGRWTVEDPLPPSISVWDVVFPVDQIPQHVLVENNYFHDNRGRGVLTKAKNSVVRNNRIENTLGGGVLVNVDTAFWLEAGPIESLQVYNNTIINTCRNSVNWFQASISVEAQIPLLDGNGVPKREDGPQLSGHQIHKSISITGNRIENNRAVKSIEIHATEGVVIRNNVVETPATTHFDIQSSTGVDVGDNTCSPGPCVSNIAR